MLPIFHEVKIFQKGIIYLNLEMFRESKDVCRKDNAPSLIYEMVKVEFNIWSHKMVPNGQVKSAFILLVYVFSMIQLFNLTDYQ